MRAQKEKKNPSLERFMDIRNISNICFEIIIDDVWRKVLEV